ncbi:DUF3231 family protein [Gracilibacillus kekensis]|uniref:DUF3231 family protein n=1 Tax=Gracilibacillus kekensis TaxID=1027249 RepID=A0A1M7NMJ5_9BACI|nr:DUF3231 family protein [Gracilibacillus kekensis]SHN04980.1 Protein of unknown function [Gracilibacillus kekensis]
MASPNTNTETPQTIKLTAPEIANLWSQYHNDTMAICMYKYMLEHAEDQAVRRVLNFALKIAERHIPIIKDYFIEEKFPIPHGFTEKDVHLPAPRLFEDTLCLTYTYVMSVNGLAGYSAALTTNVRRDIRNYFVECQNETMKLFNDSVDTLLEMGVVSRPPTISPADSVHFVEKQAFIEGLLGGNRPLSCIEISHLFWDLKKVELSKAFTMAFSQVADSKEAKKYLLRGSKMYSKHIEILQSVLALEELPFPESISSEITNSTISPFSDRLMMYHKSFFGGTTISFYGTAIGTSQRADLVLHYTRLAAEMTKYMEDGLNIMIENKWLEEPPLCDDREKLTKIK